MISENCLASRPDRGGRIIVESVAGWPSTGWPNGRGIRTLPVSFSWPTKMEGYSSSRNWRGMHVDIYVNGVPTEFAWLLFAESVAFFRLTRALWSANLLCGMAAAKPP